MKNKFYGKNDLENRLQVFFLILRFKLAPRARRQTCSSERKGEFNDGELHSRHTDIKLHERFIYPRIATCQANYEKSCRLLIALVRISRLLIISRSKRSGKVSKESEFRI